VEMRKDKIMMNLPSMKSTLDLKKKTQGRVSSRFLSESKTYYTEVVVNVELYLFCLKTWKVREFKRIGEIQDNV